MEFGKLNWYSEYCALMKLFWVSRNFGNGKSVLLEIIPLISLKNWSFGIESEGFNSDLQNFIALLTESNSYNRDDELCCCL